MLLRIQGLRIEAMYLRGLVGETRRLLEEISTADRLLLLGDVLVNLGGRSLEGVEDLLGYLADDLDALVAYLLANRGDAMDIAEAQNRLMQATAHVEGVARERPCIVRIGAFSDSAIVFWSQPSIRVAPTVVTTAFPDSAGTDLNDRPCLVRKSFARSQSENLLHGPTKRWNVGLMWTKLSAPMRTCQDDCL